MEGHAHSLPPRPPPETTLSPAPFHALLALALVACGSAPPVPALPVQDPDPGVDTGVAASLEPIPGLAASPGGHPLATAPLEGFEPVLLPTPVPFTCDGGQARHAHCVQDYRDLATARFAGSRAALEACVAQTREELLALRTEVDAHGTRPVPAISPEALATEVRRRIGLDALAAPGPALPIRLRAGPVEERGDHQQVDLVIEDPTVGEIPARLLIPPTGLDAPGLLFLPGHLAQDDLPLDDVADRRGARTLAARGFVVLIIGFRAYDAGGQEAQAVLELSCAGLSLAALRQHEAMLALRLLRTLAPRDRVGHRVGVMGHSGGAIWAQLLGTQADPDAVVFDAVSRQFLGVTPSSDGGSVQILDETVPALVELFDCIYVHEAPTLQPEPRCRRSPSAVPHLQVPYDPQGRDLDRVADFLWRSLDCAPSCRLPEPPVTPPRAVPGPRARPGAAPRPPPASGSGRAPGPP